ncbi:MAG: bifunctional folylpolyglutamate synthase/dihydrofolate synthase [Alphaproteobacteria bacterium]|nr:bifunctional folylpolyglutamate synthase/dihydrofolate synthase [Alphaproteobacteria bacterium]
MIRTPLYPKFGAPGQAPRIAAAAARLGVSLDALAPRSIAVTGSNGKGSTAAMTAQILKACGKKTGLFTSPHMLEINERFAIDAAAVDDATLSAAWAETASACGPADGGMGGFEFLFLLAAKLFADAGCDAIVWEAGIGGRHDVTRLARARLAALVSLDLEHTALLGDTLEAIALDKADITPDGGALFLGDAAIAHQRAIEAHVAPRRVRVAAVPSDALAFAPPLAGAHQRTNTALAIALARAHASASDAAISAGLAAVRWPGRLERLQGASPPIIIDVGHTPGAIRAALDGFKTLVGGAVSTLVCGASRDKDAAAIIASLAPAFPVIIAAEAPHKGAPAAAIAALARAANPAATVTIAPGVADAHAAALRAGRPVYVAGGLFLASAFKAVHLGRDPAALQFF